MVKNRLATKHHADAPTTQPDDVPASSHVAGGRLPKLEPRAASTDWQRALFNPSDLSAADEPEEVAPATESVRSEEHTSELQSLMRCPYAVFCLSQTTTTLYDQQSSTHT